MSPRRAAHRLALPTILALALAPLVLGASACDRACRERCETRFGAPADRCAEICASSCDELREKYGVSPDGCKMLKEGP